MLQSDRIFVPLETVQGAVQSEATNVFAGGYAPFEADAKKATEKYVNAIFGPNGTRASVDALDRLRRLPRGGALSPLVEGGEKGGFWRVGFGEGEVCVAVGDVGSPMVGGQLEEVVDGEAGGVDLGNGGFDGH